MVVFFLIIHIFPPLPPRFGPGDAPLVDFAFLGTTTFPARFAGVAAFLLRGFAVVDFDRGPFRIDFSVAVFSVVKVSLIFFVAVFFDFTVLAAIISTEESDPPGDR